VSFAGRIRRTISWGELDYESPRINFNEDLCAATETGLLLHPTAGKLDGDTLEETNAPLTREPDVVEIRGSALRRGRRGRQRKADPGSQIVGRRHGNSNL